MFLLGTLLIIISSAWGGASRSYVSLLWARIFQGVGTAPFEALVNAAVGDLYFVHVSDIHRICVDETYLPSNRNVANAWL